MLKNKSIWQNKLTFYAVPFAVLALAIAGCGDDEGGGGEGSDLSGKITIDGSSTVYPFAQAAAELFGEDNPNVQISVGLSGTGGGFEKFCAGETDISDASRPIKDEDEVPVCEENGVEFEELQVVLDGLSVVANPTIEASCLSTDQLKQLWQNGSKVSNLSELGNDPGTGEPLPSVAVSLFGPGTDSGTFDYFTDEINGEEGNTRSDYQPSEDDNVLVQGVAGDEGGLGYFGYSYADENRDKLKIIAVDGGEGCVEPTLETIQSGEYTPLSRPLFMYPSKQALARPEVKAFLEFALDNHERISEAAQYIPMTDEQADEGKEKLASLAG